MGANKKAPPDALSAYRAKRFLDRTPEPGARAPTPAGGSGGLFVVHLHAARQLHYDLRLELDGVLASWAVPKGPSLDPGDKRLAVHVEDHPLEYGDFEGIIPEGNYGAGAVIVWDRGAWVPLEDPHEGMAKGKLLFELRGYKLHGRWTLVKIKKSERDWLLIKERDGYAGAGQALATESVLSGLTVEALRERRTLVPALAAELARAGAPAHPVEVETAEPMLAETREQPFSRAGWVFEPKLDGYRVRVANAESGPRVVSRNGLELGQSFPEILRAVAALPAGSVLDGELVVQDAAGRPSFQRLQGRALLRQPLEIRRAAVATPATLYLFDLLGAAGYDARPLPLTKRKAALAKLVPAVGPLRYVDHYPTDGEALYQRVGELGLEGIVGKRADSPYRAGRSADWIKVRRERTGDFVVVGYTRPRGSRSGFGALDLGAFENGTLRYVGRVGSGFSDAQLALVGPALEAARRKSPAFAGPAPTSERHTWVEPALVVEVRYKEWTDDQLLRQPVFLRFRDDKPMTECALPGTEGAPAAPGPGVPRDPPRAAPQLALTNLDKVFWPAEGYTKGDLIDYYRGVAPWLLPYLRDRPLVLTRFPDGITGKSFFQKDAPGFAPAWVRTERMWSEDTQRDIDYFVCDDLESLLYIVNLGTIPLHVWGSRVATLEHPDWCILDLDPKEAPFEHVVTIARAVRTLCEEIELDCFVKTSGSTGLHVLIPLGRQCTYAQARSLGGLLARVIAADLPEIATVTRQVGRRGGRVYLDYGQNGLGQLLVAPFSARPLPGAPVSMPLAWREVGRRLDIRAFTIRTAPRRMQWLGADPLAPVLERSPDLVHALERLHGRLG